MGRLAPKEEPPPQGQAQVRWGLRPAAVYTLAPSEPRPASSPVSSQPASSSSQPGCRPLNPPSPHSCRSRKPGVGDTAVSASELVDDAVETVNDEVGGFVGGMERHGGRVTAQGVPTQQGQGVGPE